MTWQKLAKTLPSGSSQRIDCPNCGSKRTALVSNNGHQGIRAYCFRSSCDLKAWEPEPGLTLAERAAQRRAAQEAQQDALTLPRDFTPEIPTKGAVWHLRAGISCAVASQYSFGWSPKLERVIVPVWHDYGRGQHSRELAYWQGRAVDPKVQPKYLNPFGVDRAGIVFGWRRADAPVVLTEDILSAIRINEACRGAAYGMALLGTRIAHSMIGKLVQTGAPAFYIWMDPDGAGRAMTKDIFKKLSLVLPTKIIRSNSEPKGLSNDDIRRTISYD